MAEEMTVLEFIQSEESEGHFAKANEMADQLGMPEARLNAQSAMWDVVISVVLLQFEHPEKGLPADNVLWNVQRVGDELLLEFVKRPRAEWLDIIQQGVTARAKALLNTLR